MIKKQSSEQQSSRAIEQQSSAQKSLTTALLRYYAIALISLFTVHCSLFTAFAADDEVARIQEAYRNISDMKAGFVQKNYMKDLGRTDTYKGVLFIKRPSKMRWEYKGDKPQEIIINNDKILIYKKAEKQAFKSAFSRQTYGQAPVALLSGFGKVREEFNITKKNKRLVLVPKKPMGNIVSVEIETSDDDFPIKSFIINDMRSNRIEIQLQDIEINTGIKDAAFDFSLPEGVNIYEHNF
ncbi:MAG: outer membrane lipoprotein chaperone LolA [Nitrospirae bacterium]|nr:outer membrane lipoprotein chaperone LolA [Nitrospirota bacterium]MBI3378187.1 outer membrane lipoprotein chaperone LolA [Nitrospirota bacterium]